MTAKVLALALGLALGAPKTPPSLPMPPSVARVTVRVLATRVLVVTDVNLPRGRWDGEPLDVYVAFGAPGVPRAIDARLVALGDGVLEPTDDAPFEPVPTERAPRRPEGAHALLGRETMAGVVVHLAPEALARAFAPGGMAALRVREALAMPEEDPSGARSVLVRLGASSGAPLTLGRVVLEVDRGAPPVTRAGARLCGPSADPRPLAMAIAAAPAPAPAPGARDAEALAPVLADRHATDDLCVRFWSAAR